MDKTTFSHTEMSPKIRRWLVLTVEFVFFFSVLYLARELCGDYCSYPNLQKWYGG